MREYEAWQEGFWGFAGCGELKEGVNHGFQME